MTFGEYIRERRQEVGHSMDGLALLLGCSRQFIFMVETDQKQFPPKKIEKLSIALEVSKNHLFEKWHKSITQKTTSSLELSRINNRETYSMDLIQGKER